MPKNQLTNCKSTYSFRYLQLYSEKIIYCNGMASQILLKALSWCKTAFEEIWWHRRLLWPRYLNSGAASPFEFGRIGELDKGTAPCPKSSVFSLSLLLIDMKHSQRATLRHVIRMMRRHDMAKKKKRPTIIFYL